MFIVLFSCFLTTGSAFAQIQSSHETASCCQSPSKDNDCCKKSTKSQHNLCHENACCFNLYNTLVLFVGILEKENLKISFLNEKKLPETFIQFLVKELFFVVWQPPKISLNL
jgi:hypothetical protein